MLPLYLLLALGPPCPAPQVAPAPLVAPAPAPPARPHGARDGDWTWDAHGKFWWRVRPAPAALPMTFALPRGVAACPT